MKPTGAGSLRAVFESANGTNLVTLSGALDESSDVQGVFARLGGDAIINMQRVERVNSMGVHHWITAVNPFTARHRLFVDEISYALVQNANAVANLFGTGQVRSCMAPYNCGSCKTSRNVPVTAEEVSLGVPEKRCSKCGVAMEFDELDSYFSFFQIQPRR